MPLFPKKPAGLPENLRDSIAAYLKTHFAIPKPPKATACTQAAPTPATRATRPEPHQAQREVCMPREEMPCVRAAAPSYQSAATLQEMLRQQDAGFTQTLLQLIDQSGKKDSQIYKRANLSKQHFSKIRNDPNYRPKKTTALALAVALELDLTQTRDLIGRAGFALTNSSKLDLIVRFFIEQRSFDIIQINMALYEFDQPLLGS